MKEHEMAKDKEEAGTTVRVEQEYPSQILYSSPPEASTLNDWVRDVEHRRVSDGASPKDKK